MHTLGPIFVWIFAFAAGGCTVTTVTALDGTRARSLTLGPAETGGCRADTSLSAETRSFGFWHEGGSTGIGLRSARYYCGHADCQVTIWVDSGTDATRLRARFADIENVCVIERELG